MRHHALRAAGLLAIAACVALTMAVVWLRIDGEGARTTSAATITIEVGDLWFCSAAEDLDCERTISVGDTVSWDFGPAAVSHTTTECTGSCGSFIGNPGSRLWHSGNRNSGTFERTFDTAGTFDFQCNIHPTSMRGRIVVNGASPPDSLGDVDGSGTVDSIDAALILQFTAGLLDALPNAENADADQNGRVDSIDAALVLQFTAGLVDTLPP